MVFLTHQSPESTPRKGPKKYYGQFAPESGKLRPTGTDRIGAEVALLHQLVSLKSNGEPLHTTGKHVVQ